MNRHTSHRRRRGSGFTLIETLLYIALFGIIIVGIVASAYVFFESSDRNQTKSMLQSEGDFLIAKIDYALDGATAVTIPAANANGTTLTLSNAKYAGGTVTFARNGAMLEQNGVPLNNTNVSVTGIVLKRESRSRRGWGTECSSLGPRPRRAI
jgi:type II secretory pathway pseudopilin PulG